MTQVLEGQHAKNKCGYMGMCEWWASAWGINMN